MTNDDPPIKVKSFNEFISYLFYTYVSRTIEIAHAEAKK